LDAYSHEFQVNLVAAAGLAPVARELLDRANPTGSCSRKLVEMVDGWTAKKDDDFPLLHR
jgi:hypothetical protein